MLRNHPEVLLGWSGSRRWILLENPLKRCISGPSGLTALGQSHYTILSRETFIRKFSVCLFRYLKTPRQSRITLPTCLGNLENLGCTGTMRIILEVTSLFWRIISQCWKMNTNPCVQGCQCLVPICHLTKYVSFRSFLTDTNKGLQRVQQRQWQKHHGVAQWFSAKRRTWRICHRHINYVYIAPK